MDKGPILCCELVLGELPWMDFRALRSGHQLRRVDRASQFVGAGVGGFRAGRCGGKGSNKERSNLAVWNATRRRRRKRRRRSTEADLLELESGEWKRSSILTSAKRATILFLALAISLSLSLSRPSPFLFCSQSPIRHGLHSDYALCDRRGGKTKKKIKKGRKVKRRGEKEMK